MVNIYFRSRMSNVTPEARSVGLVAEPELSAHELAVWGVIFFVRFGGLFYDSLGSVLADSGGCRVVQNFVG